MFTRKCFNVAGVKNVFNPTVDIVYNTIQVRHGKHWIPKWKKLRSDKVIKASIPDLNQKENLDLSDDKTRLKLKERGFVPPRPWMEKPFTFSSTSEIFESYVPFEGDGKLSNIMKKPTELIEKKSKSMLAIRKIKSYEDNFDISLFKDSALNIYIEAHNLFFDKNKEKYRELLTEKAYSEMLYNVKGKSIIWKFVKSLEQPQIVHARCTNLVEKDNIFGQITVRFHTQQILAIYDRFGRLMHGSKFIPKDVLEYTVFEKHLANEYGTWKLHGKIIPDWQSIQSTPSKITYTEVDT